MEKVFFYYSGQQCKINYNQRLFLVMRKCDLCYDLGPVDFMLSHLMRDLAVATFCKRANLSKGRDAKSPV